MTVSCTAVRPTSSLPARSSTPARTVPASTDPVVLGIDFGTSNSAASWRVGHGPAQPLKLEGEAHALPTALFFNAEEHRTHFGRDAVAQYLAGTEGRLMRSLKSLLGSPLLLEKTEVNGQGISFQEIIATFLAEIKARAVRQMGAEPTQVVLGRPVHFVDDHPERDALAQQMLLQAAHMAGLHNVSFQLEPIAAAFDYERRISRESRVLVADIGGGTSDFSVVRVGPQRAPRLDRRDDILANHGVHIAGTDFDRRLSLASVMPPLGYGAFGPSIGGQPPRPVPSRVYFDLTTWHLINTVYQPQRMAELRSMADFYGNPVHHQRLMKVVRERLGHALVGRAEAAKIAVAEGGDTDIDLALIEAGLHSPLTGAQAEAALHDDLARIVTCAHETVVQAGIAASDISALYFTGGSTGLKLLTDQLEAAFPGARAARGDRMASVATGLGLHAARLFKA